MNDHLSPEILEGVINRTLPAGQLLSAMQHIDQCEQCRNRLAQPGAAPAVMERFYAGPEIAGDHLTYEQMEDLLDGRAGPVEREISQQHLRDCARCVAEFRDMEGLAKPGKRRPPARIRWFYYPAAAAIAALLLLFLMPRRPQPGPPRPADLLAGIVLQPRDETAVRRALDAGRMEFPPLPAALATSGGILRGETDRAKQFGPIDPLGVIVLSDRPHFRWQPLADGATYRVSVHSLDLQPVARSGATGATEWSPEQPLPRGGIYVWQVRAESGGRSTLAPAPPAAEARFQILDASRAQALEQARVAYAEAPLVLAVFYAQAGLRAEALQELERLVKDHPESPVVRRLLDSVRE